MLQHGYITVILSILDVTTVTTSVLIYIIAMTTRLVMRICLCRFMTAKAWSFFNSLTKLVTLNALNLIEEVIIPNETFYNHLAERVL